MNEYSASKPINPAAAFALGIAGFFAFAALAFVAYFFFKDNQRDSVFSKEDAAARILAHQEVVEATQTTLHKTKWLDEEKNIVQPTIETVLPITGRELLKKKPSAFTPPAE